MSDSTPHRPSLQLYFAAAAALAVSTFLPWFTFEVDSALAAFVPDSGNPGAAGTLYLLLFAGVYAGAGYALLRKIELQRLAPAMWGVNAWMVVNVFIIAGSLSDQNSATSMVGLTTSPTIGVFVAAAAVIAGIAGSVALQRSRVRLAG